MEHIPLDARIYVAGHTGLVGSAVMRRLAREGFSNLLAATREQLALRDGIESSYRWYAENRPDR